MSSAGPNYNPKEIKRAKKEVQIQENLRQKEYRQLDTKEPLRQNLADYSITNEYESPNYYENSFASDDPRTRKDWDNFAKAQVETQQRQDILYPYTYDVPGREYWDSRYRYTTSDGMALSTDISDPSVMGKVFVGPEYMNYVNKFMEREEALAFQGWILNQLDISTPVKKDYVRRKFPFLFNLIMQGEQKKMRDQYIQDNLLLRGPRTVDDFRYIYNHIVKKDLYNKPVSTPIEPRNSMIFGHPPVLPYPVVNKDLGYTNKQGQDAGNLKYLPKF